MEGTGKRGRPKLGREIVWFGMKLTVEERDKIRTLALRSRKPAVRAILDLVDAALGTETSKSLTAAEIRALPEMERTRVLRKQARSAAKHYRDDPDLDFSSSGDILEY